MEPLRFPCPACGLSLSLPPELAGVEGPCPQCGCRIIGPDPKHGTPARRATPSPAPPPKRLFDEPEPAPMPEETRIVPPAEPPPPAEPASPSVDPPRTDAPADDKPTAPQADPTPTSHRRRWIILAVCIAAAILAYLVSQFGGR